MEVVDFLMRTALSLVEVSVDLMQFLIKEWVILGGVYTTAELLFGGALYLVLGWNFTKWLIGLD